MLRGVSDFENLIMCNTEHWSGIIYKLLVKYEPESKHPCNTCSLKDCMVMDAAFKYTYRQFQWQKKEQKQIYACMNQCHDATIDMFICFLQSYSLKIPNVAKIRTWEKKYPDGHLRE